ncbi:hypothetical protein NADFUDRAFT_84129 [Nadsonia fulvescens var. elongata DSM 6958]|uniref:Uncharacterized protein n=1 Tax=Nadsonia fulvescens var. elongata DSM 6958 TaxID=857566 RepID=A0A1E3PEX1_9ASCO|nr:hypothetical protein NADFUDRAFT_84129 [Nadsonia fulvescens var. elongata DSM 6958]
MAHELSQRKPEITSPVYFFPSDYPLLFCCLVTLIGYYNPAYLFHSPASIVRASFEITFYTSWIFHSVIEPYIGWIFWGMLVIHALETAFILVPVLKAVHIDRNRNSKLWWSFILLGLCDGYRTVRRIKITMKNFRQENSVPLKKEK